MIDLLESGQAASQCQASKTVLQLSTIVYTRNTGGRFAWAHRCAVLASRQHAVESESCVAGPEGAWALGRVNNAAVAVAETDHCGSC